MALIEVLEFDAAEQVMGEGPPTYEMLLFSEQGPPGPPGPPGPLVLIEDEHLRTATLGT